MLWLIRSLAFVLWTLVYIHSAALLFEEDKDQRSKINDRFCVK